MVRFLPLALAALALAACSDGPGNTSISFNGDNTSGTIDGSGNVKIDAPGFKGDIKLPKIQLDADNFDMNGVHLYPGSTISSMNVDAKNNDGAVKVAFKSPAAATTVRDWLKERLDKAGFKLAVDGDGLKGKTDDGKDFALSLSDAGANASTGSISIAD
jgi:hypothetical protein